MTIEELIKNTLCKSGIQQAVGVELTFPDGLKMTIHSSDHPVLQETVKADATPTVKTVQSAQGGY